MFTVSAVIMAGLGLWFGVRDAAFFDAASRTPGEVVELRASRGARGQRLYRPVVRFDNPTTGRVQVFESDFRLWPSPFDVGDDVMVAYDPADPAHAEIDSFWTRWFFPLLLVGVAGVFLMVAWWARREDLAHRQGRRQ